MTTDTTWITDCGLPDRISEDQATRRYSAVVSADLRAKVFMVAIYTADLGRGRVRTVVERIPPVNFSRLFKSLCTKYRIPSCNISVVSEGSDGSATQA